LCLIFPHFFPFLSAIKYRRHAAHRERARDRSAGAITRRFGGNEGGIETEKACGVFFCILHFFVDRMVARRGRQTIASYPRSFAVPAIVRDETAAILAESIARYRFRRFRIRQRARESGCSRRPSHPLPRDFPTRRNRRDVTAMRVRAIESIEKSISPPRNPPEKNPCARAERGGNGVTAS